MKVIFLDIDGVLITRRYASRNMADPRCIEQLNRITDRTNAVIVVSSSWRHLGFDKISLILKQWGTTGNIISVTPVREDGDRLLEIGEWIADMHEASGNILDSFVIIDDEKDACRGFSTFCVRTGFEYGLDEFASDRAIAILEGYDP